MARAFHEEVRDSNEQMIGDLLAELRERARTARDTREVRLVETHISWVLLGPEVYKIKKPVTLPFLDFASFEARESACRNEVRINRRLASRTYLGVVPVRRGSNGHFTFRPGGEIVDWAVHMVRLRDEGRADVLLASGALRRSQVDALAIALVGFHARSPSDTEVRRCGAPECIEQKVADNFVALRETAVDVLAPGALGEIERWQRAFIHGRRDLFERRVVDGAIRDGHGDLRLEHVFYREGDDFEVIDGIEFDDHYRWADVCADVAFLAMDLSRLGRVDLAERFIAVYAHTANDFDLYRLLDFYESYRACIRAKIAAATAMGVGTADAARAAARAEARRCLLLAQSASQRRVLAPVLVAVAGGIATGKSVIAHSLSEELGAPVVDADCTRKHLLGIPPTSHAAAAIAAWKGAYDPIFSRQVYAEVLRRAGCVLASGRSVIIDASFRTVASRAAARELAGTFNVPFRLVECTAPPRLCRMRVAARDPSCSVSDATPAVLDGFAAGFEPITELCPTEHVHLDTGGSLAAALTRLKRELATWPRGLAA